MCTSHFWTFLFILKVMWSLSEDLKQELWIIRVHRSACFSFSTKYFSWNMFKMSKMLKLAIAWYNNMGNKQQFWPSPYSGKLCLCSWLLLKPQLAHFWTKVFGGPKNLDCWALGSPNRPNSDNRNGTGPGPGPTVETRLMTLKTVQLLELITTILVLFFVVRSEWTRKETDWDGHTLISCMFCVLLHRTYTFISLREMMTHFQ